MESLQVAVDWILVIVITLFVPALVWVAVIAGLISIVQDKVHKEEVTLPEPSPPGVCTWVCGGQRSHSSGAQAAAKDGPEWATRTRVFGLIYQSEPNDPRTAQVIHSEKESRP